MRALLVRVTWVNDSDPGDDVGINALVGFVVDKTFALLMAIPGGYLTVILLLRGNFL